MRSTVSTLLLALALTGTAIAQSAPLPAMAELKAALAPGKQVLVARQLALTPAEEADFWPVYDNYQRGIDELQGRRRELLAAIPGADAERLDEIARDLVEVDIDQADLLEQVRNRLRNRLAPAKLLHYLRLEQEIAVLARYEQG